ncbi:p21-Rho-binding domain protein [Dictyocaulus viviparus]|uniref:non-specific protein-tyrosine kinase n=1 Tax=Dictyocaulus viviparus TaxID=29172 RepID=A0A0D8Y2X5_DICVI|nr:p21-Rho-binding domain protein [Dictyocaulus viviparus]
MSRPEQKRLRKEYTRLYPSGFVGKLRKVFGRSESIDRREVQSARNDEMDQHVIPLEKITLCKELGHGEFGSVWQASWKGGPNGAESMQVAVKCVSPDKLITSSTAFLQEAAIMTRMHHENVVRLYGVVLDMKKVSELATCGSLLECLHKPALRDSFPIHVLCDYSEQIAKGMAYLESKRLIHRDLAARNVLVFSPKKVKISDFGLSRSLGVGEDYYRSEFSTSLKLPIAWCAPECINFLKFTSSSDVWSFGVTLWEMFSYGEMPWNGKTGAEILHIIDQQREHLGRPTFCPEDMYALMEECWCYNPTERPTFAQIITQFPERLPQTVRAVCDCRDAANDHLQFRKDDLILVIDRTTNRAVLFCSPSSYPDGYYWFGSLRNGRTGLFRPADTVAHLGAEKPSSVEVISSGCAVKSIERKEKEEKRITKKDKEREREKRKALISEPVGKVRHTCHVGIDGTAFGLLQLDKKEITSNTVSPSPARTNDGIPLQLSTSFSQVSTPVVLRSTVAREGVGVRETMSLREVDTLVNTKDLLTFRDLMSPPGSRAPLQPPSASMQPSSPKRHSLSPTAPPLTESAVNSMNREMQDQFNELSTMRSIWRTGAVPLSSQNRLDISTPKTKPIAAIYARTPTRDVSNSSASHALPCTADTVLCDEVEHLERDLTDFSLSSLNDLIDDTRPLLSVGNRTCIPPEPSTSIPLSSTPSPNTVRLMTPDELHRWRDKETREHKKAQSHLSSSRRKELLPEGPIVDEKSFSASLAARQSRQTPPDWTPEAQDAYKFLVECGRDLTNTPSPIPSPTSDQLKRITVIERKPVSPAPPRPATPPQVKNVNGSTEDVTSYSPQKRVHIIETKLLNTTAEKDLDRNLPGLPPKYQTDQKPPPGRPPKMRNIPVVMDHRSVNYDNLNGIGAGRMAPPPVPPKPKTVATRPELLSPPPEAAADLPVQVESPVFAAPLGHSSLFSSAIKEEVIKF